MKNATSAGGVVFRKIDGNPHVLLIIFDNGSGLSFPKGHPEGKESLEETALREVEEETGLSGLKIIKRLGIATRLGQERDGIKVMRDIHLFLMETNNYNHNEKTEEKYDWFPIDEAIAKMAFPQEADFLKRIMKDL
jgi:8-oxo-dGTP pyrophosphatase MutT (NUDIX family)